MRPIEIPTALTLAETRMLQGLAYGRRVYEAGALLGYSTVALAQVARHVLSVDPHDGYPAFQPRPTWDVYLKNLREYNVLDRVKAVRGSFTDFFLQRSMGIEFAWADLTGEEAITDRFLAMTGNVPIVAIHDYQRTGCSGATHAIDRYIRCHKPIRVQRVDSLIVIENA